VTNPGSQSGTVGTAASLQIKASDSASGQALTFSAAGLPAGLSIGSSTGPPHSGKWDAWLDGYGKTATDTLAQAVTVPSGCSSCQLSFWLHIDTAETSKTKAYDTYGSAGMLFV
jgi:Putative Ig domain